MPDLPSRFRHFLAELKRRRVVRVASLYLVGGWGAIQATTTIGPVLGAPEWLIALIVIVAILGFPFSLVLSWAFDLTSEGFERTDAPVGRGFVRLPWLRPAIGIVLMLVLVGAGWGFWLGVRPPPLVPSGIVVAVLPFDVQGGPSVQYLHHGLPVLFSVSLNGAGLIHTVPPETVVEALGAARDGMTEQSARRVGDELQADLVLSGEAVELEYGRLRITSRLYDLREDEVRAITASATGPREQRITQLVDELTKQLLSEHFGLHGLRLARVAAMTTDSLSALKAYLQGEAAYRATRWRDAIPLFRQATMQDSAFALAHYRLATTAEWAADFGLVRTAAAAAYRHRDRLGEYDRRLVEAFHAWAAGDPATAEHIYRSLLERNPADAETWYRLGEVLFHHNPMRGRSATEARVPFERALQLDPGQEPILLHLMELALMRHDRRAFDELLARAQLEGEAVLRRSAVATIAWGDDDAARAMLQDLATSYHGNVFAVTASLAQHVGDFANAERVAVLLTEEWRPPEVRAGGFLMLAQLAAAGGRWGDARAALDRLEVLHPASALIHSALFASVPVLPLDTTWARTLHARLLAWNAVDEPPVDWPMYLLGSHNAAFASLREYLLGLLEARLGNDHARERHATLAGRADDSGEGRLAGRLAAGVLGRVALENERPHADSLMAALRTVPSVELTANSAFHAHALERFTVAELLAAQARYEEAARWLAASMEGRNELFLRGPATLRLAQVSEALGRTEDARRLYGEFTRLWANADPELQHLVESARNALARLRRTT